MCSSETPRADEEEAAGKHPLRILGQNANAVDSMNDIKQKAKHNAVLNNDGAMVMLWYDTVLHCTRKHERHHGNLADVSNEKRVEYTYTRTHLQCKLVSSSGPCDM